MIENLRGVFYSYKINNYDIASSLFQWLIKN